METRTFKFTTGDWAGDGHGRSETNIISVTGEKVDNDSLQSAYVTACSKLNYDPLYQASERDNGGIDSDTLARLIKAGFPYFESQRDIMGSMMVETYGDEEVEYPYNVNLDELVMWMISTELPITYDFPKGEDTLFGGYGSILSSPTNPHAVMALYDNYMY